MARRKIVTAQEMNDLFVDAMGGDWQAESEYREAARLLAKRSNQQLLEQERRGIEGEAYRRAQYALGDERKRFKENVKNLGKLDTSEKIGNVLKKLDKLSEKKRVTKDVNDLGKV